MFSVLIPALLLLTMAFLASLLLGFLESRLAANPDPLLAAVNQVLPQSQCGQCGYPGCKPYAEALLEGAPLDLCQPGGQSALEALQRLLGRQSSGSLEEAVPSIAWIDEALCIGCTLCIPACPVDAIVGAKGWMHSILIDNCTGCELCIDPCPVDCIQLRERRDWETQALGQGTQVLAEAAK